MRTENTESNDTRYRFGLLSLILLIIGLILPPIIVLRHRAWSLAGIFTLIEITLAFVFFYIFVGPAILGLGLLWLIAAICLFRPKVTKDLNGATSDLWRWLGRTYRRLGSYSSFLAKRK